MDQSHIKHKFHNMTRNQQRDVSKYLASIYKTAQDHMDYRWSSMTSTKNIWYLTKINDDINPSKERKTFNLCSFIIMSYTRQKWYNIYSLTVKFPVILKTDIKYMCDMKYYIDTLIQRERGTYIGLGVC